jgi:hypothetical protein
MEVEGKKHGNSGFVQAASECSSQRCGVREAPNELKNETWKNVASVEGICQHQNAREL